MSEHDDFEALMTGAFGDGPAIFGDDETAIEEYIPTREEDLRTMIERLVSLGAGERALAGTVVNTDNDATFPAIYGVSQEPPAVVQIALGEEGHYTVTKVAVDENDDPQIDFGRGLNYLSDPQLLYDMHTQMGDEGLHRLGGSTADIVFSQAFYNVEGFTPEAEEA
jgi:hypothetical protein